MDHEEKQLLEETAKLAKENNKLLKKMHRHNVWSSIVRSIRAIVVVGAAVWIYYLTLPWIQDMQEMLRNLQEAQQSMVEMRAKAGEVLTVPDVDFSGLQNMLDAFTINGQ